MERSSGGWKPWTARLSVGLAIAASGFGRFGGDLLVGNLGGNRRSGTRWHRTGPPNTQGSSRRSNGQPVAIDGVWALSFGNGGPAGAKGGCSSHQGGHESHGLFGRITANK